MRFVDLPPIVLTFIGLISCLEPFDFKPESFEEIIVIEGTITNETKAHLVKVSYTYPLQQSSKRQPANGAIVSIETGNGNQTDLVNIGNGVFTTPTNYKGVVGEKYKLHVLTADNKRYESTFDVLKASPPIDSIYAKYTEQLADDGTKNDPGIQFFIDTHDDTEKSQYYRYEWQDTYEVKVPFSSQMEIIDGQIVFRSQEVGICYEYDTSSSVLIGSSANSSENRIAEFPIKFVSQNKQHLRTRYSINVKQYTISEDAFLYYRKLQENNEFSGSLFDKQSGTITGNVFSKDNPNEPVLGYFEVSGSTEERAFFNPIEFDSRFITPGFRFSCDWADALILAVDDAITFLTENNLERKLIYYVEATAEMESNGPDSAFIFSDLCSSCDWYADTSVPEFWIE